MSDVIPVPPLLLLLGLVLGSSGSPPSHRTPSAPFLAPPGGLPLHWPLSVQEQGKLQSVGRRGGTVVLPRGRGREVKTTLSSFSSLVLPELVSERCTDVSGTCLLSSLNVG